MAEGSDNVWYVSGNGGTRWLGICLLAQSQEPPAGGKQIRRFLIKCSSSCFSVWVCPTVPCLAVQVKVGAGTGSTDFSRNADQTTCHRRFASFCQVDGGQRLLNLVPAPTWEPAAQDLNAVGTVGPKQDIHEVRQENGLAPHCAISTMLIGRTFCFAMGSCCFQGPRLGSRVRLAGLQLRKLRSYSWLIIWYDWFAATWFWRFCIFDPRYALSPAKENWARHVREALKSNEIHAHVRRIQSYSDVMNQCYRMLQLCRILWLFSQYHLKNDIWSTWTKQNRTGGGFQHVLVCSKCFTGPSGRSRTASFGRWFRWRHIGGQELAGWGAWCCRMLWRGSVPYPRYLWYHLHN